MNDDPFNLNRFVLAQDGVYQQALSEIKAGRKSSHWMWFIFPQIDGLGSSPMARKYSIKRPAEAKAYLNHPLLGPRLLECASAAMSVNEESAVNIFGSIDAVKLRSSATLFAAASKTPSVFHQILARFFNDDPDPLTLKKLGIQNSASARDDHPTLSSSNHQR